MLTICIAFTKIVAQNLSLADVHAILHKVTSVIISDGERNVLSILWSDFLTSENVENITLEYQSRKFRSIFFEPNQSQSWTS